MLQQVVAARVGGAAILDGGMGTFLDMHGDVEPILPSPLSGWYIA